MKKGLTFVWMLFTVKPWRNGRSIGCPLRKKMDKSGMSSVICSGASGQSWLHWSGNHCFFIILSLNWTSQMFVKCFWWCFFLCEMYLRIYGSSLFVSYLHWFYTFLQFLSFKNVKKKSTKVHKWKKWAFVSSTKRYCGKWVFSKENWCLEDQEWLV